MNDRFDGPDRGNYGRKPRSGRGNGEGARRKRARTSRWWRAILSAWRRCAMTSSGAAEMPPSLRPMSRRKTRSPAWRRPSNRRFGHSANPDQQCGNKYPQEPGGLFAGRVSQRSRCEPDLDLSDVPRIRAWHERFRLRPHSEYDFDHEPCVACRAHRLFLGEGGAARVSRGHWRWNWPARESPSTASARGRSERT